MSHLAVTLGLSILVMSSLTPKVSNNGKLLFFKWFPKKCCSFAIYSKSDLCCLFIFCSKKSKQGFYLCSEWRKGSKVDWLRIGLSYLPLLSELHLEFFLEFSLCNSNGCACIGSNKSSLSKSPPLFTNLFLHVRLGLISLLSRGYYATDE